MPQSQILSTKYQPHFSGHETFPLRYGWLKKAYDSVVTSCYPKDNRSVFVDDDAIARFGVGKNMVASIRHWAGSVGVLTEDQKTGVIAPGPIGDELFGDISEKCLDPYLENPSSLWLIHWQLCNHPKKTTWHYVFSHFHAEEFERSTLVDSLLKIGAEKNWKKISATTIKRDVECFLRSYVSKPATANTTPEDTLESPLSELGLIKLIGKRDHFRLVRGSKPTLGNGVFLYALVSFWLNSRHEKLNQLPFESIAHDPGSPGRVFLLDEDELATRLVQIDSYTNGVLNWSETSGIKSIMINSGRYLRTKDNLLGYIHADY
jgi:hypothetical protein